MATQVFSEGERAPRRIGWWTRATRLLAWALVAGLDELERRSARAGAQAGLRGVWRIS